jgi:hypothetical protein
VKTILLALATATLSWGACASSPCSAAITSGGLTASITRGSLQNQSMELMAGLDDMNLGVATTPGNKLLCSYGMCFGVWNASGSAPLWSIYFDDTTVESQGDCFLALDATIDHYTVHLWRDVANMRLGVSVYENTTGMVLRTCVFEISALASTATIQARGSYVGGANTGAAEVGGTIRFLRVRTGVTPATLVTPISGPFAMHAPAPHGGQVAACYDLVDYEFDNSLDDCSSGGVDDLTGTPTYSDTDLFGPVCPDFPWTSLATGSTATLNASACYSLNDSATLTYEWAYAVGFDGVDQSATIVDDADPTTTSSALTLFGGANFTVTVTDTDMDTASSTAHFGVVPVNPTTYAVDMTTAGFTAAERSILGPQIQMGHNPSPWADNRVEALTKTQLGNLNASYNWQLPARTPLYLPFWRDTSAGTISFSSGSATITGSGTNFQTAACGGGTSPSDGAKLIWQYTGTDSLLHYGSNNIASCASATSMAMATVYPSSPVAPWPSAPTGVTYHIVTNASSATYGYWVYNSFPGNYYENAMAARTAYARSGIDWYQQFFLLMSDYWNEWNDYFYDCVPASNNKSPGNEVCSLESRYYELTGVALYAVHTGAAVDLAAARNIGAWYSQYASTLTEVEDQRNDGYVLAGLAVLCQIDGAYNSGQWCTDLADFVTSYSAYEGDHGDAFQKFYTGVSSITNPNCSATVTNGSKTVTISGSGCVFPYTTGSEDLNFWSWGGTSSARPTNNAAGDSQLYPIDVVNVGAGTLTLYDNYTGSTTSGRGFTVGGLIGWGFQPYMEAILGQGFYMAANALNGIDNTARDLARAAGLIAVEASMDGYNVQVGGMYNGVTFPGCPASMTYPNSTPLISSPTLYCWGAELPGRVTASQARDLSLETQRAYSLAYAATSDAAILAMVELFRAQAFCPQAPIAWACGDGTPDGEYLDAFDTYNTGGIGTSLAKHYGQFTGFAHAAAAWPGQDVAEAAATGPSGRLSGNVRFSGNIRF